MNNLIKIYNSVPRETKNRGLRWYQDASDFANELSEKYKVDYGRVCGVISALSPANYWENNKQEAEQLIVCYVVGGDYTKLSFRTYGANVAKAWDILTSLNVPVESFFNAKTGAKTLNFYYNILTPKDTNYITLDRHMIAIINGNIGKPSGPGRLTPKQYRETAAKFIKTANKLKLVPCELQAMLWEHHINLIKQS